MWNSDPACDFRCSKMYHDVLTNTECSACLNEQALMTDVKVKLDRVVEENERYENSSAANNYHISLHLASFLLWQYT